jgi:cell division protein FtsL
MCNSPEERCSLLLRGEARYHGIINNVCNKDIMIMTKPQLLLLMMIMVMALALFYPEG